MNNCEDGKNKYINSFIMSPSDKSNNLNILNSTESMHNDHNSNKNNDNSPSIELTQEIISKFDKLINKEEYFNFQERIYKLNKAIISIANSYNLNVSSFNSNLPNNDTPENSKKVNPHLDISPNKLLTMLDELLIEKENNEKSLLNTKKINDNIIDQDNNCHGNCSFTVSSSDDEDMNIRSITNQNDCNISSTAMISTNNFTKKKKKLLKYLYNYELLYKTFLLEKSLNKIESDSIENSESSKSKTVEATEKICEEIGMNMNLLSNFSKNKKISKNVSDASTPNSNFKSVKNMSIKCENAPSTPSINKFFFEDREIQQKINNKRRRSLMEEQKIIIEKNPELNVNRRRSDFMLGISQYGNIRSQYFTSNNISNNENSFVSKFETGLCIDDENDSDDETVSIVTSNIVSRFNDNQKRSSMFRDKNEREYYLTNIYEIEEFNQKNENNFKNSN